MVLAGGLSLDKLTHKAIKKENPTMSAHLFFFFLKVEKCTGLEATIKELKTIFHFFTELLCEWPARTHSGQEGSLVRKNKME